MPRGMLTVEKDASIALTLHGEARIECNGRVTWTSDEHVYVAKVGEDAQRDHAPNVANALRWLARMMLDELPEES